MSVQVYIDGVEVEADPDKVPAFTFQISDPFEPGSIKGVTSTEHKIPATHAANRQLGSEVMAEAVSTLPSEYRVGCYGQTYVRAKISPIEWDRDEIRAITLANNATWIQHMRGLKLRDMDLGASGTVNADNIVASWLNEDQLVYYPIIDYGYDFTSVTAMGVDAVRPGHRCHMIIAKAFNDIGYSVKVKGALNKVWKKFVMPATEEPVLDGDYLDGESLAVEIQGETIMFGTTVIDSVPPWIPAVPLPPAPVSVDDPGGNNTNTYFYTTPFLMNIRVRLHLVVETLDGEFNYQQPHYIYAYRTDTSDFIGPPTQVTLYGNQTQTFGLLLADLTIAGGVEIGVSMASQDPATAYRIKECRVLYEVYDIPYQIGVSVDMAKSAPNLSVGDLIKGICLTKNIAVDTDDVNRSVVFSYADDKYKDIFNGNSLIGREDHSDPPVKIRPMKPKRVLFKWKDDDDDVPLTDLNKAIGERGWGGYIHQVGGVLDDKVINLPFAATRMKMYPGSCFLPVIREDDDVHEQKYDWQPRLLIAEGVTRAEWTLQGVSQQIIPKCYFVYPTETQFGLSFYPEDQHGDTGAGAFELRWRKFFRRFDKSQLLEIDLWLRDYELARFDFGVPVQVHDGYSAGWYYFTKIEQKRFGIDEPTRCTLIQVNGS